MDFNIFNFKSSESNTNPRNGTLTSEENAIDIIEMPQIEDEFETQAVREVAAASNTIDGTNGDESLIQLSHKVKHQVALPKNYPYNPIDLTAVNYEQTRTYPFTLDPFQHVAIACIERKESVLVAAHTSAGKTVVAEHAIASSLKENQRVIYTSPIKALSNQKYRELLAEFGDVGLMTGDVTINPSATALVMTTEILRSMLYKGSEVMREVAWVIFDEVHYMRDKERGVVWEETIILLPDKVRYVFLSATIPNAMQFAEWVCSIHSQPCHVVHTNFRPTPLQHYIYPSGADGIYLILDENNKFREENFQKCMNFLQAENANDTPASSKSNSKGKGKASKQNKTSNFDGVYKILKMVTSKNFHPVIVFSFSKRECEALALKTSKLDLNNNHEKELTSKVFENAIDMLSEEDKKLPQIEHILPLLRRGIGIHHSGLLPLLKEVIEILFQEGLIKILFATETFSIGLNMPAKTVIFSGSQKFDGQTFRSISSGEYTQASGRAGRRGLDERGIVILMMDEKMEPVVAKSILTGLADKLDSAFHLGYNMLLNLMRVEGVDAEYLMEKSFFKFQAIECLPKVCQEIKRLEMSLNDENLRDDKTAINHLQLYDQLKLTEKELQLFLTLPSQCLRFIQPGRLLRVSIGSIDYGWGVILGHRKENSSAQGREITIDSHTSFSIDICILVSEECDANSTPLKPISIELLKPKTNGKGKPVLTSITLDFVSAISSIRIFLPKDLNNTQGLNSIMRSIAEVESRFPDGIAQLDPIEDMKIDDPKLLSLVKKIEALESKLTDCSFVFSQEFLDSYKTYKFKQSTKQEINKLQNLVDSTSNGSQLEDLRKHKNVLKRLGFIANDGAIELKGRVACEVTCADELIVTELIFSGIFRELSPEHIATLLSCLVFDEKMTKNIQLPDELSKPLRILQEIAKKVAVVSNECHIEVNVNDYICSFNFTLMQAVYAWCQGNSFLEICKMTDVFEGSIVRIFKRLEELLRQIIEAAKVLGNEELEHKVEASISKLNRGIVATSSLYL